MWQKLMNEADSNKTGTLNIEDFRKLISVRKPPFVILPQPW